MADDQGQLDFSDLGGQRVGEAGGEPQSGSFFSGFGDMGARALQNPPDWLKQWPAPNTRLLDFSDLGGQRITGAGGHASITPTQTQHQAMSTMPNGHARSSSLDFSDLGGQRVSLSGYQSSTQSGGGIDFRDLGGRRVNLAQTAQDKPELPGFSQRWAEGMGIPVTQEEEDAMREEMKPKWYDFVAPGWGRGLKMLYGVGKNAYEHAKEAANEAVTSAGNISKGEAIAPNLVRAGESYVENQIKSVPGGEQLWNFGGDVADKNWRGAAGGTTAAFLQALLMDAIGGERPSAPKALTPSVPPTIPAEEVAVTPRPVADTPGQPFGKYERESSAPALTLPEPQRGRGTGSAKEVAPPRTIERPQLPAFTGKASGVFAPTKPPGPAVPFESGPRTGARSPFHQADGHVETQAAFTYEGERNNGRSSIS